jgi:hypothetical protein
MTSIFRVERYTGYSQVETGWTHPGKLGFSLAMEPPGVPFSDCGDNETAKLSSHGASSGFGLQPLVSPSACVNPYTR